MIAGKDWVSLVIVTAVALGFITLMIVVQALQHGRSRGEIIRGVGVVWAAVAMTLLMAWLLEDYWGGAVIDVQVAPSPEVVTRPLTTAQIAILAVMLAAIVGLYITAILTVRKLAQPADGMSVRSRIDEPEDIEDADETEGDAE